MEMIRLSRRSFWFRLRRVGERGGLRAARSVCAALLGFAGLLLPAHAVVFYWTADPTYNTTPPTGKLADSGWQWVGLWAGCQGTPIGPHHFLTARHIGGTVGDAIVFRGVSYATTAFFEDPATDLRICEIGGTFPGWAPLYRTTNEVGRSLVVFGTGMGRGSEIMVHGLLRGWRWGEGRGTLRWGENVVVAAVDRGPPWGPALRAIFDPSVGFNVAQLASGDSSGPVFIDDGAGWKLAGIAAFVDGLFNTTPEGSGFDAAIFDARGLYFGTEGAWHLAAGTQLVRSGFYATRVSVRAAWIDAIIHPVSHSGDLPTIAPPRPDATRSR